MILTGNAQDRVLRQLIQLLRQCQPAGALARGVLAGLGAALYNVTADTATKYHAELLDPAQGLLLPFAAG